VEWGTDNLSHLQKRRKMQKGVRMDVVLKPETQAVATKTSILKDEEKSQK